MNQKDRSHGIRESLSRATLVEGHHLRCRLEGVGNRRTVGGLLADHAARHPQHPVFLERQESEFRATTWAELRDQVLRLVTYLRDVGVMEGSRVGVISRNRGEMLACEFAVMGIGAIYTPLFAGYSKSQLGELLAHSRAEVLFVAHPEQLDGLELSGSLHTVVCFESLDAERHERMARAKRRATDFSTLMAETDGVDTALLEAARAIDTNAPCLMMYTSGTSGRQKGVLLTHENILSQQRALSRIWDVTPQDRMLCYLPWHHSFGGIFEKYTALAHAAPLAIDDSYGKDFDRLLANWKLIRPTLYFSVPLVHQQLVSHVRAHPEEEAEIFHDGLKFVFTAAAPLPSNISDYFAKRRIPVVEGWGLTETSPCCTLTDPIAEERQPGVIGHPIPEVEVCVASDGEILVRGPNVMPGYFDNPEATKQAFPGDGWFHTGDLGEIERNKLRLLSRKDRVFKMLNAEKVVPTLFENELVGRNRYIRHALVVGGGRDFLAAVIFPNRFLIEQQFGEDLVAAERIVLDSFRSTIEELNAENPVKYEHIQAFAVIDRELSVEAGDLTPSLKMRIKNVLDASEAYVDAIYEPLRDCDCSFLNKILRLEPDERMCPVGKDRTLDRCHECAPVLFGDRLTAGGDA